MNRMLERMNHVLLAVAILAVLSLTSCEHKDLCHDSLHVVNVKVVFDWRKAPDFHWGRFPGRRPGIFIKKKISRRDIRITAPVFIICRNQVR